MAGLLKTLGADVMGTSDNCVPIGRFGDEKAGDMFSFLLPGEVPWILLKSKVMEFMFTDLAFIQIERDNAVGSKRLVRRFPYFENAITNVCFETAGTFHIVT